MRSIVVRKWGMRGRGDNTIVTDLKQPDLSYSHFGQSLKTFLCGQLDQSAV